MIKIYKTAAIPRIGLEYQDLCGIEFLIDLLIDRNKYEWVQIESDGPIDGFAVGGLDDIVAKRKSDKKLVVRQVKFTVDPQRDDLTISVSWLTGKKPRGESKLGKWSSRLVPLLAKGVVHDAALQTNRKPDKVLCKAIVGEHLIPSRLPSLTWKRLVAEVGTEKDARAFFKAFRFLHSQPMPDDYHDQLRDRIVPDYTDDNGWRILLADVRRWATEKTPFGKDDRITHQDLRRTLSPRRPKPLRQDFVVPRGYIPPDDIFHRQMMREVVTEGVRVVYGPPGRGKSTYLSYLAGELAKAKIPVARHHYFLDLDERGGRTRFVDAANSLIHQMGHLVPPGESRPQEAALDLRKWIEKVGAIRKRSGKPLIIVIDGLDHIWREAGNIDQLNHLFNELLPLPPGVSLVVGTQPVTKTRLPNNLSSLPSSVWYELPGMSPIAVLTWLGEQHRARTLFKLRHGNAKQYLSRLADAFHQISAGHPLHLIYSLELAISRSGGHIHEDLIRHLPLCPDGDIKKYYRSLWAALSAPSQELMYTIVAADFAWPKYGIFECLKGEQFKGSWSDISHLLQVTRLGILPFHESVVAFIKEQPHYANAEALALPKIARWLRRSAADYWRWSWLWLISARQGKPKELLNGTTRSWATDAISSGYSIKQITRILEAAEKAAFDSRMYARLVEIRSIKIRLLNNSDSYQRSYAHLLELSLQQHGSEDKIVALIEQFGAIEHEYVVSTSRAMTKNQPDAAWDFLQRLDKRLRYKNMFDSELSDKERGIEKSIARLAASLKDPPGDRVIRFTKKFERTTLEAFQGYLDECFQNRDFARLASHLGSNELTVPMARHLHLACIRLSLQEGIALDQYPNGSRAFEHPLGKCIAVLKYGRTRFRRTPEIHLDKNDFHDKRTKISEVVHYRFFDYLADHLRSMSSLSSHALFPDIEGDWILRADTWLKDLARETAQLLLKRQHIGISFVAEKSRSLPKTGRRADYSETEREIAFYMGLDEISVDLALLSRCLEPLVASKPLSLTAFSIGRWNIERLCELVLERGIQIFSAADAKRIILQLNQEQLKHVVQFDDRMQRYMLMARLARFSVPSLAIDGYIASAARCLLGYGYHKDTGLYDVLDAVDACKGSTSKVRKAWIRSIGPTVDAVRGYTDGDDMGATRTELIALIGDVSPTWLPFLYRHYLGREKWQVADDIKKEIIARVDWATPMAIALGRSLTGFDELTALQDIARSNAAAKKIFDTQSALIGGLPPAEKKEERGGELLKKQAARKVIDATKFAPLQFKMLLAEIAKRDAWSDSHILEGWLSHWMGKKKGKEALDAIEQEMENDRTSLAIEAVADNAAEAALAVFGKAKAFKWFARAHVVRHGWNRWYDARMSKKRLARVAALYPDRWEEFLRQTCADDRREKSGIAVGRDLWVGFLTAVGQNKLAEQITETMVRVHLDDMADQPISQEPWTEANLP